MDDADATEADVAIARANALKMSGLSESELRRQAAAGQFSTVQARLAWMVLRGTEPPATFPLSGIFNLTAV
jgi:hypothetical protein